MGDRECVQGMRLPYVGYVRDGRVTPGMVIRVHVDVHESFDGSKGHFIINLATGPKLSGTVIDDIALHFDVRANDEEIVLNSLLDRGWGKEIRSDYDKTVWKVKRDYESATVTFIAGEADIQVMVNNSIVTRFAHRIHDVSTIRFIEVKTAGWTPKVDDDEISPDIIVMKTLEFSN